jgi:hypothetical protein
MAVQGILVPVGVALPERSPAFRPVRAFRSLRSILYVNPQALPRAYVLSRAVFVPTEEDALEALVAENHVDVKREGVLVGTPATYLERQLATGPLTPAHPARILEAEPERVVVEVDTEGPRLLMLVESFAPGWTVTVNGEHQRLWQANYSVRGVIVPPGGGRVVFSYQAPGFALGIGAAAFAVLIAVTAAATKLRQ